MTPPFRRFIASIACGLLCAAAVPALAASTASSSVSDSITTSVGSLSTSLENSSHSSTKDHKDVAQGDYRITDMAALPERQGTVRVTLQALARPGPEGELLLYLPAEAAQQGRLAPGGVVTARHRAYGVEFAEGEPRQAFYLALDDAWYRELRTRAVVQPTL